MTLPDSVLHWVRKLSHKFIWDGGKGTLCPLMALPKIEGTLELVTFH